MARVLVAYCSRSGITRKAAIKVAEALGADIEEIVDRTRRSGLLGYLRSIIDVIFRLHPPLRPVVHDPSEYDLVVVGSPVWNASMSSAIRAYLATYGASMRSAAFFCTCKATGGEHALRQMSTVAGKPPSATLVLHDADVERRTFTAPVERFARAVRTVIDPFWRSHSTVPPRRSMFPAPM